MQRGNSVTTAPKIQKRSDFNKFKIMTDTKEMTKEQRLSIFREEYKSVIRRYEREVEKYTLKMNEDYEYFFRWYADDLYKAVLNLAAIRSMRPMLGYDDPDKVAEGLKHHIENIERNLIEGTQTPTSTSMMMNAAEVLKRAASQGLRNDLQGLLYEIAR